MMVIYWGVEFLATFVEQVLSIIFGAIFIEKIDNIFSEIKRLSIVALIGTNLIILINHINLFSYINSVLGIIIVVFMQIIYFKRIYFRTIISSLVYVFLIAGIDFITVNIGAILVEKSVENILDKQNLLRCECILVSKTILIIIIYYLYKYIRLRVELPKKYNIGVILLASISIILNFVAMVKNANITNNYVQKLSITVIIFSFILFLLYFYLIIKLEENNRQKHDIALLKLQNEMIYKAEKNTEKVFSMWRSSIHDYKHKIYAMNFWIEENDIDKLKSFLLQEKENMSNQIFYIKSGNQMVDAIINTKKSIAEGKKIKFICDISMPEKCRISDMDIVCILGNLLDNAIEACERQELDKQKQIEVRIKEIKSCIYIKIINTYNDELENQNLVTSKEEKFLHGIGIKSIKSIVEKYDGDYRTEHDMNERITSIMIPI